MTVYVYGCACGSTGVLIRALKREHGEVEVINTKYDTEALQQHIEYLNQLGVSADTYKPVVLDGEPRLL